MLREAIQKAKGDEDKKVGVSLKMSENFRNKLQIIADENNISLNALIISMLEVVYEKENSSSIYETLTKLGSKLQNLNDLIEKGVDSDVLGYDPYLAKKALLMQINDLEKALEYLGENE
ncbi:hypothetical protein PT520_04675 [Aliarcobacter butzleri]|uniref:Toxin-antitoxin system HicB family antitoxin n=1 Tax=Aliarcobacter butzleri TaxID=28197 RepID=A0AAW6VNK2_9BACT|nr:hypothetical protein [Aliarcobacter butzleri]MDK2061818.1 hypothetical protein [Aliarcobacter butzleri]